MSEIDFQYISSLVLCFSIVAISHDRSRYSSALDVTVHESDRPRSIIYGKPRYRRASESPLFESRIPAPGSQEFFKSQR